MQTFLPYPEFERSAAVLDTMRLGKQRVETLQILRALSLPEYGWRSHPVVAMWRGRRAALVRYGLSTVAQWRQRGFPDSTAASIAEFAPEAVDLTQPQLAATGRLPSWVGDERLHRSHRSKLLAKNPGHYANHFCDVPADLDYFWPEPDEVPEAEEQPAAGRRLWVVQPESSEALGRFLVEGVVGLGVGSGVTVDASGLDLTRLRDLLASRRVTRPLRALARFLTEVQVGDEVAVLVEDGRALLLGQVVGDYEFLATGNATTHRRRVRWDRTVPRSAVEPTYALQDVRPLFDVRLAGP